MYPFSTLAIPRTMQTKGYPFGTVRAPKVGMKTLTSESIEVKFNKNHEVLLLASEDDLAIVLTREEAIALAGRLLNVINLIGPPRV